MTGENRQNLYYLKNTIQEYQWGSLTMIPRLLGNREDASKRQAELWIGAHPKAPSVTEINGKAVTLIDLIKADPLYILGSATRRLFGSRLPFLLKVLAAETPLSIQVHPDQASAREGFDRENSAGLDLESSERNYRDANHKPETICALTPFSALNGFRSLSEMEALLERRPEICCGRNWSSLKGRAEGLLSIPDDDGWEREKKPLQRVDEETGKPENIRQGLRMVPDPGRTLSGDMGFLAPLMLNLVT
jgi:mannose-6-phosphate isomerase